MEKILEAMMDEITTRVIAKLEANASGAYSFLKLKVKAENIEGLTVDNIEGLQDAISDAAEEAVKGCDLERIASDAAADLINGASFEVNVRT